ncbi:MAG: hypothetical protein V3U87_17515 [Methylococcaceae bacterium]
MYPLTKPLRFSMPVAVFCIFLTACGGTSSPSSADAGEKGARPDNTATTSTTISSTTILKKDKYKYPPAVTYSAKSAGVAPYPEYLQTVSDSSYATKITRVTNKAVNSQYGDHPYSVQGTPWNYDSTIFNLGNRLYVSSNNKETAITSGLSRDDAWYKLGEPAGGGASLVWSHTDSNIMYSVTDYGQINKVIMNASRTDVSTTKIMDISAKGYETTIGNAEGQISNDGKLLLIIGKKNGNHYAILYNFESESVVFDKQITQPAINDFDNMMVDATGEHIVAKINNLVHVYDMNLNYLYQMPTNNPEGNTEGFIGHSSMAVDVNGDPVVVSMTHHKHTISMFNLRTKQRHELLNDNHGGGHISTGNYRRQGWAYVSTEGWGDEGRDAFSIKLDPNTSVATVEYFAHTNNTNQNNDYNFQTHVGVNPTGDVVLFRSKWGTGTGDTYLARAK